MGDEADADWDAGLIEAGIEESKEWCRQQMDRATRDVPFHKRNQKRGSARRPHVREGDNEH
jgi:hypothetical protein